MNTKNIKFSVLRLSLCCVLWGTSCLLFVYVRRFSKHFYSIIFTEALWKCFYMKNWNLYFIFHHEKYCWMDFYKYAFCFLREYSALALAGCVFLRLFYPTLLALSLSSAEMFQVEAFKVSYYFLHTNRKLLFEVWTSSHWSSPHSFLNIFYVTNSYEFFGLAFAPIRFLSFLRLPMTVIFYHHQKYTIYNATLFMKLKNNKDKLF